MDDSTLPVATDRTVMCVWPCDKLLTCIGSRPMLWLKHEVQMFQMNHREWSQSAFGASCSEIELILSCHGKRPKPNWVEATSVKAVLKKRAVNVTILILLSREVKLSKQVHAGWLLPTNLHHPPVFSLLPPLRLPESTLSFLQGGRIKAKVLFALPLMLKGCSEMQTSRSATCSADSLATQPHATLACTKRRMSAVRG